MKQSHLIIKNIKFYNLKQFIVILMTTPGMFQQVLDPTFDKVISRESILYIQKEIARRLSLKYNENISIKCDEIREKLLETMTKWRGPLSPPELYEMVICNTVADIDTDIQTRERFSHFDPRTLYDGGFGITREERVKLKPSPKWEFQMNY